MIKYALRKCDRAAILALERHIEDLKSRHDEIERMGVTPGGIANPTLIQCYGMGEMKVLEDEIKALSHFLKAYMEVFKNES